MNAGRIAARVAWLALFGTTLVQGPAFGEATDSRPADEGPRNAAVAGSRVVVVPAVRYEATPPLWAIPSAAQPEEAFEVPGPLTEYAPQAPGEPGNLDPVAQTSTAGLSTAVDLGSFDGLSRTGSAPPDTNGAIGATQYMQWANSRFAVFDKVTGTLLSSNSGSTLFAGTGPPCETNGGDGVILYDRTAGRWLFSQLLRTRPSGLFTICIALSTTSDATGSFIPYSFDITGVVPDDTTLVDYPKYGAWPDSSNNGYFYTANIAASSGSGTLFCAFDRANMLLGNDASAQCVFLRIGFGSYLPADFDGSTLPPSGSPNFLVHLNGTSALAERKFSVDWNNPDNTTLTDPIGIPVAPFTRAATVPQLGTTTRLESIGDRLMFRLAYRNFGDHESLVMNHSVIANGVDGVRWYELRSPNATPTVFQQGTYVPDNTTFRWLGSIAMDRAGDIAVGYNASSDQINPAIRYAGRVPGDPLGTLEPENSMIEGSGSETVTSGRARWGDYSSMTIDPADDCTLWYTSEYFQTDGGIFNWSTRIGRFRFPTCGS